MMNDHLIDYFVITGADLTAVFVAWLCGRRWFVKELSKIKWQQSGNVWWLACDLHSVKLLADMNRRPKMLHAIDQAIFHAGSIGIDDHVSAQLRKLKEGYAEERELTQQDKNDIRERIDALIDYCGKLAERDQPQFKPKPEV